MRDVRLLSCTCGTMVFPSSLARASEKGGMYFVHEVPNVGSPTYQLSDDDIFPALVLSSGELFVKVLTRKGLVRYMGPMCLVSR